MDVFEAIYQRRSIPVVRPDPVPREMIRTLLAAGAHAPNHYRVRPWRFIVVTGEARVRLGEVMAQSLLERQPDATEGALAKERARPLRAPTLIVVAAERPVEPKVSTIENVCAAAAAAQNILLAATALGLGAMWRTGAPAVDPNVKRFLGLHPDQHLIGFIYVGFPETGLSLPERDMTDDRTTWLEDTPA